MITLSYSGLRAKERKHYTDEGIDDDEIEGKRNYDVTEKIASDKYDATFVETLTGQEFNLQYIQETGLQKPIVIHDKTGLGMRIPSQSFQVSDVKQCVGSRRMLDVMDVNTQKGLEMSMKDWVKYYETTEREQLLNVISLEFSHTRLETYVESPTVVRQIDWVDTVWPRHLKEIHTEATNIIEKMKYPKVQKYCLMSVAGCYTDFHIDFGGTSVWYHILHGEKVFWLVPPTEENMEQYENWVLSGKQGDIFLGDQVSDCQKIVLEEGDTFMIPSGWIHAVYTPKDSLVFGGNFIHSFNIRQQLRVAEMEDRTRVPQKFRYPFYTEIMWYVLAQYLKCLRGKSFLKQPGKENGKVEKTTPSKSDNGEEDMGDNGSESSPNLPKSVKVELTRIDGSTFASNLTNGIESSSRVKRPSRKALEAAENVSLDYSPDKNEELSAGGDPGSGIKIKRENSDLSEKDSEIDFLGGDKACKVKGENESKSSSKYVHLTPYELEGLEKLVDYLESLSPSKRSLPKDMTDAEEVISGMKSLLEEHKDDNPALAASGEEVIKWPLSLKIMKMKTKVSGGGSTKAGKLGKNAAGNRRRRTRCKKCPACMRGDCAECNFCKDMKKFGGPGRMKQSCISRQCMAPVLPNTAICIICNADERVEAEDEDSPSNTYLMECGICWEIVHPSCLTDKYENLDNEGVVNEDLPNSWECPKCCFDGKQGQLKPRIIKGKEKLAAADKEDTSETVATTSLKVKHSKMVEGKRVTSKIGSVSKLKSTSLIGQKGKLKKAMLMSKGVNRKPLLPNKVNVAKIAKQKYTKTLEKVKSPPVVTRSGRTVVQKRAPDQEDELDITPSKRPRREEPIAALGRGSGRGKRGRGGLVTASVRGQVLRLRTEPSTPGSSGRRRGRGRGGKRAKGRSVDGQSVSPSESSTSASPPGGLLSAEGSWSSTPFSREKGLGGDAAMGKGKPKPLNETKEETRVKQVKVTPRKYVVRPAPIPPPSDTLERITGEIHVMTRPVWLKIFKFLPHADLARSMAVCKTWNRWCIDRLLWHELDLSHKKLKQVHLLGIVRRQPTILNLNYAVISPKQLSWLIERLPHVTNLSLAYCSWATLSALCSSSCPLLGYLDLSWASGLKDMCFKDLISPPIDHRPAVRIVSRLHRIVELQMAGTDISDSSLAIMPRHLTSLEKLDLSYCIKLTNQGIEYLTNEGTSTRYNLKELDLTGCNQLTSNCFNFLANCPKLVRLKLKACHKVAIEDCQAFTVSYAHRKLSLRSDFDKLIVFTKDTGDI